MKETFYPKAQGFFDVPDSVIGGMTRKGDWIQTYCGVAFYPFDPRPEELHDASEAYLVDLPRPIKRHSEIGTLYQQAEAALMAAICERFRLSPDEPEEVTRADKALLCVEARALLPSNTWWEKWTHYLTGRERSIAGTWTPAEAEREFLEMYCRLIGRMGVCDDGR